jgi:plastocyanin
MANDEQDPIRERAAGRTTGGDIMVALGAALLFGIVLLAGFMVYRNITDSGSSPHGLRQRLVVSTAAHLDVDVIDNDYKPAVVQIPVGSTITFNFTGAAAHSVTDDYGRFDSGIKTHGNTWDYTFTTAGTYTYYCTLHHVMQGKITVQ